MRVVVVSQYFPPETGGPQNRLASLATGLSDAGHDVTVLTAKPSYPAGVVFEGYEDGFLVEGWYEGVRVLHTWVLPDEEKTKLRRLLYYMTFVISAALVATRRDVTADVVIASSPPLTVGLAGWIVSRLTGARFVFDVRDLWPDVAVAMGALPEGWPVALARRLEEFIYRQADGIAAVTQAFCRDIRDRTGGHTPVICISNGTVPSEFRVSESRSDLRADLELPDGFLVTYAGNLGLAQGLAHVLEAAEMLKREDPEVAILLVGDGPLRDDLKREASKRELNNVEFRKRVALDEAARYMAASDVLLVPLREGSIYRKFIPSKLFDAMAAARPVLLSVDGEAREILEEAGAGLYYPPGDAESLMDAIHRLKTEVHLVEEMGARGREYVTEHFSRAEQARKMTTFLEQLADSRSASPGPT